MNIVTENRLQRNLERLHNPSHAEWFAEKLKEVLESDRPPYAKADTVAAAFMALDEKIAYIDEQIKSLGDIKRKLKTAKERGLEVAAQVLQSYGVDRLDGTLVSSLTITPPKESEKLHLKVIDPHEAMKLGYVKFSVDEEAIKEALKDPQEQERLSHCVEWEIEKRTIASKIRINRYRNDNEKATWSKPISNFV